MFTDTNKHRRVPRAAVTEPLERRALLAASVSMLGDLNTIGSGLAHAPVRLDDNRVVYIANDGIHGNDLWVSDGTEAGTTFLKDTTNAGHPRNFTRTDNFVYFTTDDAASHHQLWRTDGTPAGTIVLLSVTTVPPLATTPWSWMTAAGNKFYFTVSSSTNSAQNGVYCTDGQVAGTQKFSPSPAAGATKLTGLSNGNLFFVGFNQSGSEVLCKSDGTTAGTQVLGITGSIDNLAAAGDRLFFTAITPGGIGWSIYATDFNATVTPSPLATFGGGQTSISTHNNLAYFVPTTTAEGTEPWVSDGTVAGTHLLKDLAPGPTSGVEAFGVLGTVGSTIYFWKQTPAGTLLWRTDGTPASTQLVTTLSPSSYGPTLGNGAECNGKLFFLHSESTYPDSYWETNGTDSGTHIVYPRGAGPEVAFQAKVGARLFLMAREPQTGYELWTGDGTLAGTHLTRDVDPSTMNSDPAGFVRLNNSIYFFASDGSVEHLYRTDGTSAGTLAIDLPVSDITSLTLASGRLYFVSNGDLWSSDGTSTGTAFAADLPAFTSSIWSIGNHLFFYNADKLWHTDGTTAGTVQLSSITFANLNDFTAYGSAVIFSASDGVNGTEIWRTDGTAAGTMMVKDIRPGSSGSAPRGFTLFNGLLYFRAFTTNEGYELWKTNGTTAGTVRVTDMNPGPSSSVSGDLYAFKGKLYFGGYAVGGNTWLNVSDGTALGTTRLKAIGETAALIPPVAFVATDDKFFFLAETTATGVEMYASDGTAAGTSIIVDLFPGTSSANQRTITPLNGSIYFDAYNGTTNGIWSTDGSAAGTVLVTTLTPGYGNHGSSLAAMDNRLFFDAATPLAGNEPWALTAPPAYVVGNTMKIIGTSGTDQLAITVDGRTSNAIVSMNGGPSQTFALDAFTSITFVGGDGDDQVQVGDIGATKLIRIDGGAGNDSLVLTAGAHSFTEDLAAPGDQIAVTILPNASATFTASQHVESLNVLGTAILAPHGSLRIMTRDLSLASNATLDVNNNSLIIDYTGNSALNDVIDFIRTARSGGNWGGPGIASTSAKTNPLHNTTLGVMESSDFKSIHGSAALFADEAVDTTAVLVKYTYYGDTDFNGIVDFDDYSRIDSGFTNNRTGWLNGDVDGNGIVDFDDYSLIDQAFNTQGQVLRPLVEPAPSVKMAKLVVDSR